jgi:hypothetical protein
MKSSEDPDMLPLWSAANTETSYESTAPNPHHRPIKDFAPSSKLRYGVSKHPPHG